MSRPQPDLVLYRPGIWRGRHPGPADISLLIEISDSTLAFDLGGKLALYRASEIQEYWVVDLNLQCEPQRISPSLPASGVHSVEFSNRLSTIALVSFRDFPAGRL